MAEIDVKEFLEHAGELTLDELSHHGVKGQKWGRRRYQDKQGRRIGSARKTHLEAKDKRLIDEKIDTSKKGSLRKLNKQKAAIARQEKRDFKKLPKEEKKNVKFEKKHKNSSEDHKEFKKIQQKKLSEMTNKELNALLTRQRLEQQYKQLNPRATAEGEKFIKEVLREIAKEETKRGIRKGVRTAAGG